MRLASNTPPASDREEGYPVKRILTTAAVALGLAARSVVADDRIVVEVAYLYSHLFDVTYEKTLPKFYAETPNKETAVRQLPLPRD